MTYLPELRESLVTAVGRQAAAPTPARPARPPRLGASLVLGAGAVIALAVTVLALVLAGRRPAPPRQTAASPPVLLSGRAASLAAARSLITQFIPPPDARPVTSDPSPRWLAQLDNRAFPGTVDIHRFFVARGSPDTVMAAIQRIDRALLGVQTGGSAAGESSGTASRGRGQSQSVLTSANYELPADGLVMRQINVMVATARSGESGIRVDAQALWTPPRPPAGMIPDGTRQIVVRASGVSFPALRSNTVTGHHQIAFVVGFLNSLPSLARPRLCRGSRIQLTFVPSAAVAVVHPSCGLIELRLPGTPRFVVTWNNPPAPLRPRMLLSFLQTLVGVA